MLNIRGSDLTLLVSLNALLEEANVTRAAARLNISQPAVSAQLARLRELFGDPLLLPAEGGRGMTLTTRALELKAPLFLALKEMETILNERPSFAPLTAQRTFSVATSDNALVMLGLNLITQLAQDAGPGVRISFRNPREDLIANQLENGEVDALVSTERLVPLSMKTKPLLKDRYIVAQRKGHPRGIEPLTLDSYCELRHILVSNTGGSFEGFVDELLRQRNRSRDVAVSVQTYSAVPLILTQTDYLCVLPSMFARQFADRLDIFEPPMEAQEFTLLLAWHARNHANPSHIWLRDRLTNIARSVVSRSKDLEIS